MDRPKTYSEEPFQILAPLAKGGMAEVFIARQVLDDGSSRLVAVKKILPALASQKKNLEMFLDEARISARFEHPNVVRIFEHGRAAGSHFIVMEYLEGESLGYTVARAVKSGQGMPPDLAAGILAQVCDALHYAHALTDEHGQPMNIIHRDISPQNIIVLFSGRVKLLDFGIARADMRLHQTRTGVTKGKYAYMSPEQCLGRKLDGRSDLFSLGIVMWEVLSGRRLFKRGGEMDTMKAVVESKVPPIRKYRPDVPTALQAIALRALDKKPGRRFAHAGEMARALRRYLERDAIPVGEADIADFMGRVLADRIQVKRDMLLRLDDYSGQPEALSVLKPDSDAVMPSSDQGPTSSSGEVVAAEEGAAPFDDAPSAPAAVPFSRSLADIDQGEEDEEERRETTMATAVESRSTMVSKLDEDGAWGAGSEPGLDGEEEAGAALSAAVEAEAEPDPETAAWGGDGVDWEARHPPEDDDAPDTAVQRLADIQAPDTEPPAADEGAADSDPAPSAKAKARRRSAGVAAAKARQARRARAAETPPAGGPPARAMRGLHKAILVGASVGALTLLVLMLWPGGDKSSPAPRPAGASHPSDLNPSAAGDHPPGAADPQGGTSPIAIVQIDSSPEGCVVLLDGKKLDRSTPIAGLAVPALKKHRVSVLCAGRLPATRDFKAEAGENVGLVFRLDDDKPKNDSPQPGAKPAPEPKTGQQKDEGNAPARRKHRTRQAAKATHGSLRLNTNPWTEVFLAGRSLGITPLLGVKLKAGRHELQLVNRELGVSKTLVVTIRPGRTTKLYRKLQ